MRFDRNDPLPGKYDIPWYVGLALLVVLHTIDSHTPCSKNRSCRKLSRRTSIDRYWKSIHIEYVLFCYFCYSELALIYLFVIVAELNVHSNQLTGSIPTELGNLSNLGEFAVVPPDCLWIRTHSLLQQLPLIFERTFYLALYLPSLATWWI
jgi:hypothetical protein